MQQNTTDKTTYWCFFAAQKSISGPFCAQMSGPVRDFLAHLHSTLQVAFKFAQYSACMPCQFSIIAKLGTVALHN